MLLGVPMRMEKSPPTLEKIFEDAFPDDPRAVRRKMFGYEAGFVNGNMFGGLFENDVVLRLGDDDRQTITAQHAAAPFEPMGRPMKGYVLAPSAVVGDPPSLREWLRRAFEYAASLPAKEKKPAGAKKSSSKR